MTLEEIKSTAEGAKILAEWIGDGGNPVPKQLAEMRAMICEYCPENVEPNWWNRVTNSIANAMKAMLSVKSKLELSVSNDEKLGVCRICGCNNQLSVWCPSIHLRSHTSPELLFKYPKSCWKRKAIEQCPQN